jgi:hypothetical protein
LTSPFDRFAACSGPLLHHAPVAQGYRSRSKTQAGSGMFVFVNEPLRRQLL